jgi:hypothetical protein
MRMCHPITRGQLDVRELPQPRIHLIDVAAGAIRETLFAPQEQPAVLVTFSVELFLVHLTDTLEIMKCLCFTMRKPMYREKPPEETDLS